ncbi:unnamed protein product (macronuclear) [Paramecium tetraurelia]|uniref:PX domain-containing protein n=1 Tax=Paramecium tetraurelia TaxID=5888 RepID=A0BT22_PARTE|nr:uncharacterized protein GSPATT00031921001 [Paramecium tetraurelia]CAK61689.1 unnamed protein product [Paramecium tetraurelia]|eukprot:XP_001429087.1 hypothetical protein (macronuclear) [Paramecium tetraurelia strain d4-2]
MSNQNQQFALLQSSQQSLIDEQMAELPILSFLNKRRPIKAKTQLTVENNDFEIEIINTKVVQNNFTVYEIKIQKGTLFWIFQTRYSLLESLSSKLSKNLKSNLPKFPEKRLFGNLDNDFIEKRGKQLDSYLKALFKLGRSENTVREFVRQTQKAAFMINDPAAVKLFNLDA